MTDMPSENTCFIGKKQPRITNIDFLFWICDFSTGLYLIDKRQQWKYSWGYGKYNLAASVMEDLDVLK